MNIISNCGNYIPHLTFSDRQPSGQREITLSKSPPGSWKPPRVDHVDAGRCQRDVPGQKGYKYMPQRSRRDTSPGDLQLRRWSTIAGSTTTGAGGVNGHYISVPSGGLLSFFNHPNKTNCLGQLYINKVLLNNGYPLLPSCLSCLGLLS